jgi:ATP-dependent Clp protease ATP-binding subunit ClpC
MRWLLGQAPALKREFEKVGGFGHAIAAKLKTMLLRFHGVASMTETGNFNETALRALACAQEEAPRLRHDFIGTEHVLLGLLRSESGPVPRVLRKLGLSRELIAEEIETFVGLGPDHQPAATIPYTPRARKALAIAAREAKALNHVHVGAEHVFLGLLIEGDGVAARVLQRLGVRTELAREAVRKELGTR